MKKGFNHLHDEFRQLYCSSLTRHQHASETLSTLRFGARSQGIVTTVQVHGEFELPLCMNADPLASTSYTWTAAKLPVKIACVTNASMYCISRLTGAYVPAAGGGQPG